jgi:hypothetical protein
MPGPKQPTWIQGSLGAANTTLYFQPFCARESSGSATEANVDIPACVPGTIRKLKVVLSAAPGSGKSQTFTFRKNAAGQAVTVTISDLATSASDTTNAFTVADGDLLAIQRTATGTPTATSFVLVWEFEATASSTTMYGWGGPDQPAMGTSTVYWPMFNVESWTTAAGVRRHCYVPIAGTMTEIRVALSAAPGVGNSRVFVVEKNGVAQDGTGGTPNTTITISDANTTGSASFSLSVSALDQITWKHSVTGTPTNAFGYGTHSFVATTVGQMVFYGQPDTVPTVSATSYNFPLGGSTTTWNATETARELIGPLSDITLSGLYVIVESNPGATTLTFTLRKNTAATAQTVSMTGADPDDGPSSGAAVLLTSGDTFAMECVASSTGTSRAHMAFLMTDPTAAIFNALLIAP